MSAVVRRSSARGWKRSSIPADGDHHARAARLVWAGNPRVLLAAVIAARAVGLPRKGVIVSTHGARHTAGSSYAVMGAGQKVIASLLGHADTAATERYTRVGGGATAVLVEARWARLRDRT
jgi:integrase